MEAYFKIQKQWLARKRIHYSCDGRIEYFVPGDYRLSPLGKPHDAKRSSGRIFLSYPHTHCGFLYYLNNYTYLLVIITDFTSLMMPNDPRDGFFYPTLTLIVDSYII